MLKSELKAELAKERDRVEREIIAWLRTQIASGSVTHELVRRLELGEYREVPVEVYVPTERLTK